MKTKHIELVLILIASITFYGLFWQEKMGLNILIFDLIIIIAIIIKDAGTLKSASTIATILGTLSTAALIVWNNSLFTKVIHLLSFSAMVGFSKQAELKFLGYSFLLYIVSFGEAPMKLLRGFSKPITAGQTWQLAPIRRSFRISLIPVMVLILFYGIYHFANPEFRALSNNFWSSLLNWFSWNISIPQMLFYALGLLISITILTKSEFPIFKNLQKKNQLNLIRRRGKFPRFLKGMINLKSEFQSGLILLFSLNVLLFVVNILDIKNYWFGQAYDLSPYEMKRMVHEGTYLLIFALLLAMIILSFFFRRNLNFFPKNEKLKRLSYFWIAQNAILAITLFIKNYRYIEANGLAYKRIGVLIFLTLVFAGLLTIITKIRKIRTFYYLLQSNAWIAYTVLILCCFIDWDIMITRYNLSHQTKNEIDYTFLIEDVSDKNVFLLVEQKEKGLLPDANAQWISRSITLKQNRFLRKQEDLSWLSWNYADYRNSKNLKNDN